MAFTIMRTCRWLEDRLTPRSRTWNVRPENIQGVLWHGFEALPHASYLFIDFGSARAMGRFLRWYRPASTPQRDVAVNLALSYQGVRRLALPDETMRGFNAAFREGMTSEERAKRLGDVGRNDPATWAWGGPDTGGFDAVLLVLGSSTDAISQLRARIDGSLAQLEARVVHEVRSELLPDGREHFGFRGGIAQPYLACDDLGADRRGGLFAPHPEHNTVAPGEFLMGYTNAFGELPPSPKVKTRSGSPGAGGKDLGRDGSYMVLRQLSQDVKAFWHGLDAAAGGPEERELLAAKVVGRWRSGAPLVLSPEKDCPAFAGVDDFGYATSDPDGLKCPFGAHVRRANPRDWRLASDAARATVMSNQHRIIRRSRPYGTPLVSSLKPDDMLAAPDDGRERGLMFTCFNADLARQYEVIQEAWLNNPSFGRLRNEVDPLLGNSAGPRAFTVQQRPVARRYSQLAEAVTVRGGSYFFLPSLSAIDFMATHLDSSN